MKNRHGLLGSLAFLAVFAAAAAAVPALWALSRRPAGDRVELPILLYHKVCTGRAAPDAYTVTEEQLRGDLTALHRAGYTPVSLSQVLDYARAGGPLPARPVLLMFDDADASVAGPALDVLRRFDAPAAVAVIGDEAAAADRGLPSASLGWDRLAALAQTGQVELASHSASLHTYDRPGVRRLPGESADTHAALLAADAARMQTLADGAGADLLPVFAYPYGAQDENAEAALRAAGILATLTSEGRVNLLTRSPDCLFGLGRFNRAGHLTSAQVLRLIRGG